MRGSSWKSTKNSVLQKECFTLSTVFIRFVEPEITVGLRVCRDASEVDLFVGSSYRKQKQLKFANGNLYKKFCLRSASVLCTVSTIFIGFVEPEINQLWGKVFDTFRQLNRSFDSKHLVFTTCAGFVDRESRYCSLLLFRVREINRFLEIRNRGSRKILRVSRNSNLELRCSILKKFEDRGSSFESRLSTYLCPVP